ncbi:RimJ/RimL family protein N-acetyltransferase [Sphingomonas zeicaulis]|uniref:GNAT family N-acetyltransferase n=1 Tax=Sphingomonas zeicaulis TaxID=1632740 RepID=UPI003D1ED952
MFAQNGLEDGEPVVNIGYAVPEAYRGHGLAKATLIAALAELSAGLAGARISAIHIEAVIAPDNLASLRVAAAIFDAAPTPIIDRESELPALHYTRRVASRAG